MWHNVEAAGDATDCSIATEQILFRKSVAVARVTLVTSSDQDRDTPSCHRHITHEQRCHLHTISSLQS